MTTVQGMPAGLARNPANFDDLDFRVYTNQQWQDLHKSHGKDVVVHWPDGHETKGIEKHIEDVTIGHWNKQGSCLRSTCSGTTRSS
jgi:hypothetical protein